MHKPASVLVIGSELQVSLHLLLTSPCLQLQLSFSRPASVYSPCVARGLLSILSASRLPRLSHLCLIRPVTAPKLLPRLHLSLCISSTWFVSFISILLFSPLLLPSYLLLSTFCLLYDLPLFYSLLISTPSPCGSYLCLDHPGFFLSSSPHDKEPRWRDGFQRRPGTVCSPAGRPRRLCILLDKQVR